MSLIAADADLASVFALPPPSPPKHAQGDDAHPNDACPSPLFSPSFVSSFGRGHIHGKDVWLGHEPVDNAEIKAETQPSVAPSTDPTSHLKLERRQLLKQWIIDVLSTDGYGESEALLFRPAELSAFGQFLQWFNLTSATSTASVNSSNTRKRSFSHDLYSFVNGTDFADEALLSPPPPLIRRRASPHSVSSQKHPIPLDTCNTLQRGNNVKKSVSNLALNKDVSFATLTPEQKRNNHIISEKRRRQAIKDAYNRVQAVVPSLNKARMENGSSANGLCKGMSKAKVVEWCELYIKESLLRLDKKRHACERLEQLLIQQQNAQNR